MTGSAKTTIWMMPIRNSETTFPTSRLVGLMVVRIISVTRFSFSSRVEFSIWFPRNTMTTKKATRKISGGRIASKPGAICPSTKVVVFVRTSPRRTATSAGEPIRFSTLADSTDSAADAYLAFCRSPASAPYTRTVWVAGSDG